MKQSNKRSKMMKSVVFTKRVLYNREEMIAKAAAFVALQRKKYHHKSLVLSARDAEIFVEALIDPPEMNEALKRSFKRGEELLK